MDFRNFTAGYNDHGRRLDKVARKFLSSVPLSVIYKSIRSGFIKVNGAKKSPDSKIKEGDTLKIADFLLKNMPSNDDFSGVPSLKNDMILFKNDFLIVINKPYDMQVQQSKNGELSLDKIVFFDALCGKSGVFSSDFEGQSLSFKPGPLHRLDKKTTGAIVFSQNLEGAKWFSFALQTHKIKKTYLAIVKGKLRENQIWNDKIFLNNEEKNGSGGQKFHTVTVEKEVKIGSENEKNAGDLHFKDAETQVFPLGFGRYKNTDFTFVKFEIKTGRKHQIRAQSAYHGFPLLGDTAYGCEKIFEKQDFFLHSFVIDFPIDNPCGMPRAVKCEINNNFENFLERFLINKEAIFII